MMKRTTTNHQIRIQENLKNAWRTAWMCLYPIKQTKQNIHGQKAQSIVEFVLVLPILLILVMGVIEFGRLLFVVSAVTSASREAARYGSAVGESTPSLLRYQDYDGIVDAARRVGSIAGIDGSHVTIKFDTGPGSSTYATCTAGACNPNVLLGDRIVVEVTRNFEPMVPLLNIPAFPIRSATARTIVTDVYIQ